MLSGAYLAGKRGALLMQNSGLGNCINTLASLNIAAQIPVVLVISHRGDLGEFNPAQVPMGQAAEQILEALDVRTSADVGRRAGAAGRRADQARLHELACRSPSCCPELTGGKARMNRALATTPRS